MTYRLRAGLKGFRVEGFGGKKVKGLGFRRSRDISPPRRVLGLEGLWG